MSPSDLDVPVSPSADQIRRKEFATVRRGYDLDQVRDYLAHIAAQVEALEKDLREIKLQSATKQERLSPGEALAAQVAAEEAKAPDEATVSADDDPYERLADRFATVLRTADEEAARLVEEATGEAIRIHDEATAEADHVRLDAQARAEEARQAGREALEKAKAEADRTLSTLAERRETLFTQMQEMQSRLLSVAKDLEASLGAEDGPVAEALDAESVDASTAAPTNAPDVLDPRYEDLWVSEDAPVDIPDLTSIELDFDEEDGAKD
jgi:cell division initiation protein